MLARRYATYQLIHFRTTIPARYCNRLCISYPQRLQQTLYQLLHRYLGLYRRNIMQTIFHCHTAIYHFFPGKIPANFSFHLESILFYTNNLLRTKLRQTCKFPQKPPIHYYGSPLSELSRNRRKEGQSHSIQAGLPLPIELSVSFSYVPPIQLINFQLSILHFQLLDNRTIVLFLFLLYDLHIVFFKLCKFACPPQACTRRKYDTCLFYHRSIKSLFRIRTF